MIYTVLLNPSIDHILWTGAFRPGDTLMAGKGKRLPLGKGMNVACTVSALGEEVKVIGLMGKGETRFFNTFAREQGVLASWIAVDGAVRQNVTIKDVHNHLATHIREPGFRVTRSSVEKLQNRLLRQIRPRDWVVFCGSLPPGLPVRVYRDLILSSRKKTGNILLDTSGKPLVEGLRGMPMGIKPNLSEFEEIFQEKINGIRHMALKAKSLLDRGIENVFLSLGSDGLLAVNRNYALRARVRPVRSTNSVGCGDALLAGILVGLKRGYDFEKACALGVGCGATNTLAPAPGLIRKREAEKLAATVETARI